MSPVAAAVAGPVVLLASGAQEGPDPQSISPGLIGFLATFGLVLAVIVLFVNMTGRLRRLDHRNRQAKADAQPAPGRDEQPGDRAPGAASPGAVGDPGGDATEGPEPGRPSR